MRQNIDIVLGAFEDELKSSQLIDRTNETYVFMHEQSSPYLQIGEKLRSLSQRLDASFSTIEQWEKRDEARGFQSR